MSERRRQILPALAALLALLCIAAAFASRTPERESAVSPQTTPTREESVGAIRLSGFFDPEPGPRGLEGRWIGDAASVEIRASGKRWLAFHAASLRRPRALTLDSAADTLNPVEVSEDSQLFVAGPFRVKRRTTVRLSPVPGPQQASRDDTRKLSVLVAGMRLLDTPAAAAPGGGFYAEEIAPGGQAFNWMQPEGVIEVASAGGGARRVWLTFSTAAADTEPREVEARSGGSKDAFSAPAYGDPAEVTIGPFPLEDGRARIKLEATPGPASLEGDDRRLSLLVSGLSASLRPPSD